MAKGARSAPSRTSAGGSHRSPVRLVGVRMACARLTCANDNAAPFLLRLRRLWPWAALVGAAVVVRLFG